MQRDDSLLEITPLPAPLPLPEYHMEPFEVEGMAVEYSDRGPGDFVISGPLADNEGHGRRFPSWDRAERWVKAKYGARVVRAVQGLVENDCGRWGYLIRRGADVRGN